MKNNSEKGHSKYFANWLNNKYGFDYIVDINREEDSPVDAFLTSKQKKFPRLKLQFSTSEGKLIKNAIINKKRFNEGKSIEAFKVKPKEWIGKVIERKKNKYPPMQKVN